MSHYNGCGCGGCNSCTSHNEIQQAVNDALAFEKENLEQYETNAAQSATDATNEAAKAAESASAAAQSQTNAETAASTATQAASSVTNTAVVLEETAERIEQAQDLLEEQISAIQTKPVYFEVSTPTSSLVLPETETVFNVRSIYVASARQDVGYGFTFDKATRTITLADEITADDIAGTETGFILVTAICDVYSSDDPTSFPVILASNVGASNIGTSAGITVEEALSTNNINAREHWRRQLAEVGLNLVDGSFEHGAEVSTTTDAVWHIAGGQCYTWGGALPKTVPAGSTPQTSGGISETGWVKPSFLRSQLSSAIGDTLVHAKFGVVRDYLKGITFEACGCIGDGVADDTAAVQIALDYLKLGYFVWSNNSAKRYKISSNVIVYAGPGKLEMNGARFVTDASMSSGFAVTVKGIPAYNSGSELEINLAGPYSIEYGFAKPPAVVSGTLDGICFGDPDQASQVTGVKIKMWVEGFRRNAFFGPKSVYLLHFDKPHNGKAWQYAWDFECPTDSGENISIYGGVTFNCLNAAGTAENLHVGDSQYTDLYFKHHSFDYSDIVFNIMTGIVNFDHCHFENNSNNPYGYLTYTSGKIKPQVYLTYTRIDAGNAVAQTYANQGTAAGRPVFFKTAGQCVIVGRGGQWSSYGHALSSKVLEIDKSKSAPVISTFEDIFFDIYPHTDVITLGDMNNALYNGDLSKGDTSGWSVAVVGGSTTDTVNRPTIAYDASSPLGAALKVTGPYATGGITVIAGQKVKVKPGKALYMSGKWYYSNINGAVGSTYPSVQFFTANGDVISSARVSGTQPGNTTSESMGATKFSSFITIPNGADYAIFGLRMYQVAGAVYLSNAYVFMQ